MPKEESKQIEMPGFEAPEKPENILPQYKPKPLIPSEIKKTPEAAPNSVSKLIDLIQTKKSKLKKNRQEIFKVKIIDRDHWIDFINKEEGKATILFMFLSNKQYPKVANTRYQHADMLELSRELYSPDQEVADNVLEQVGVYLFSEYKDKAADRNLSADEIEKGIDYCLDEKNRLTIKAMVRENRGIKNPDYFQD